MQRGYTKLSLIYLFNIYASSGWMSTLNMQIMPRKSEKNERENFFQPRASHTVAINNRWDGRRHKLTMMREGKHSDGRQQRIRSGPTISEWNINERGARKVPLTSTGRYIVALLDVNHQYRAAKRRVYTDCGFPAALVSRVILRSVRRARTAFWQFSRFPRRLRPRVDPSHPLRLYPTIHPWSLSAFTWLRPTPSSVAQVHHDSLACTRSAPLYPQTRRARRTTPRPETTSGSTYAFNAILSPPAMAIRHAVKKHEFTK